MSEQVALTAERVVQLSVEEARDVVRIHFERAIENARSFDDLRRVGEQSEAFRRMFDAVGGFLQAQNECAYQKATVHRAMGDMLSQIVTRGGDPNSRDASLADIGVNFSQSSRWQQLASIPQEEFEDYVAAVKERGEELTTSGLLKLAKKQSRPEPKPAPPLPEGQFSLILADPPWQYEYSLDSADDIENHYPTMDLQAICDLPVISLSAENSVLFLWTTSPKLPEGLRVIQDWGFRYRSSLIWSKSGLGMGYYARINHEFLLIGIRGEPGVPLPENRPVSIIEAPKGRHSEKPEVFRETIESMYPTAKRIELFCRNPRPGWAVWGNEVENGA